MKVRFLGAAAAVLTLGAGLAASVLDVEAAGPVGATITVAGGNGAGGGADQLNRPLGVAIDERGNIFVADTDNSRVQRFGRGSTQGVTVAGTGVAGAGADQLSHPDSIALDDKGNLYVTDSFSSRIQRWNRGATQGVTIAGGEQVAYPAGIALDRKGNLYVADMTNHRVQRWAIARTRKDD